MKLTIEKEGAFKSESAAKEYGKDIMFLDVLFAFRYRDSRADVGKANKKSSFNFRDVVPVRIENAYDSQGLSSVVRLFGTKPALVQSLKRILEESDLEIPAALVKKGIASIKRANQAPDNKNREWLSEINDILRYW